MPVTLKQIEGGFKLVSDEPSGAIVRLRVGDKTIMKSFPSGHGEAFIAMKEPQNMDMDVLALSKSDVAPLYVSRQVINAEDIHFWYKCQGFRDLIEPEDMHVTVAYSRDPVSWQAMGNHTPTIHLSPDLRHREVKNLGAFTVQSVRSDALHERWSHFLRQGASWDYNDYTPH